VAQVFYGLDALADSHCPRTEETESTNPNQWLGLTLSSPTTRLLTEWALVSMPLYTANEKLVLHFRRLWEVKGAGLVLWVGGPPDASFRFT